jgi:tetratricopeptide (TPR) repeat protein
MRRRRRVLLAFILAATAAVYAPNLGHPFQYDDDAKILQNPRLADPVSLFRAFAGKGYSEDTTRLIPNLTFSMNYFLFGFRPFGYHLTNLLLHLLNVWLVARLGRAVLRRLGVSESPVPLLAAVLYGLHPLNSEAVNYCNARPNLVCTTFYLATLLALLRSVDHGGARRWVVFPALALGSILSKELGLTVVLAAPLLLAWLGGLSLRRLRFGLYGLAVLGVVAVTLTGALSEVGRTLYVGETRAGHWALFYAAHAAGQAEILLRYLGLTLLPLPGFLNVDHEVTPLDDLIFPVVRGGGAPLVEALPVPIVCTLVILALIAAAIAERRRQPFVSFFALWPFLTHAPTSFVPRGEAMVEYRTVLPMVGVCLVLAWALAALWAAAVRRRPAMRESRIRAAALAALALVPAAGTLVRNSVWKTPFDLWADTVAKSPGKERPHYNLGNAYESMGMPPEAMECYARAIKLNPDYARARNNLGALLSRSGRPEEALPHILRALALEPDYAMAHSNLGLILGGSGRTEEARAEFAEAVRLQPRLLEARFNLGLALVEMGRWRESKEHFLEAVRLRPDLAEGHFHLGNILGLEGKAADAADSYRLALALRPQYAEAHLNLGVLLDGQGRIDDAAAHLQAAVQIRPGSAEAHYNLANVYRRQGRTGDAEAGYLQALRLRAAFPEARYNLGVLLEDQGKLKEAEPQFAEAVRLRPDFEEAQKALERVRRAKAQDP